MCHFYLSFLCFAELGCKIYLYRSDIGFEDHRGITAKKYVVACLGLIALEMIKDEFPPSEIHMTEDVAKKILNRLEIDRSESKDYINIV